MQQLAGKLALVTGGGRGIGAACAKALAEAGAQRHRVRAHQAELEAVAKEIGGIALVCDVTDRAATDRMLARAAGRIDILVNNAGIAESAVAREDDRRAVGPHHGARRDGAVPRSSARSCRR